MGEEFDEARLGPGDIAVLAGYFVLTGLILWGVSRHQAKSSGESNTESYFLAERSVSWWAVAASLFASNIGSEHFVGLAGGAAQSGVAMGFFEVGAIPVLIATGLFFLPIYLNAKVQTTPDYLERRYSLWCRTVMVAISLLIYVFSRISATLYAGELILTELVNINKLLAVVLLVSFTALYTVLGGLEAVIYTEALQTFVLLIGGFMMVGYALGSVGGFSGLSSQLQAMEDVPENFMHFFRPPSDPVTPWTGFLFGFYVYVPWYFGVDQVIVQRALAAKDVAHGQLGCVVAACFKFVPFFIMVVPGLCARVVTSQRMTEEELNEFDFDKAFPWMVINVIPINMRGLIVASMLSSLMSALASVFNSAGTLFALNIWKVWYPDSPESRLVLVGRMTVVVLALVALAWLPILPLMGKSLFTIINKPLAYLAPPIFCLYIWGMLSRLPNRRSGEWTLTFGIVLGSTRFFLEVLEDVIEKKLFGGFTRINYMHFAGLSFWLCSLVLLVLSLVFRQAFVEGDESEQRVDRDLLFRPTLYDELMSGKNSTPHSASDPEHHHHHSHDQPPRATSFVDSEGISMVELSLSDAPHEAQGGRLPQRSPSSTGSAEEVRTVDADSSTPSEPRRDSCADGNVFVAVHWVSDPCFGKRTILGLSALVMTLWLTQVIVLG